MEALNPYLAVSIADLKEAHRRSHSREREPLPGKKTVAKQVEVKQPDVVSTAQGEKPLEESKEEHRQPA